MFSAPLMCECPEQTCSIRSVGNIAMILGTKVAGNCPQYELGFQGVPQYHWPYTQPRSCSVNP